MALTLVFYLMGLSFSLLPALGLAFIAYRYWIRKQQPRRSAFLGAGLVGVMVFVGMTILYFSGLSFFVVMALDPY